MGVLNIPLYPDNEDRKHISTSWKITSDVDGVNIIESVIESEENKNAWIYKTIVPNGKVYYGWARRHFLDSKGNKIDGPWLTPIPLTTEDEIRDYLKPKTFIKKPVIKNINYDLNDGLNVELAPIKTNVGYKDTALVIKDNNFKTLFRTTKTLTQNDTTFKISNDDVNFKTLNNIYIYLTHRGELEDSAVTEVMFKIPGSFYTVIGNRYNLDPVKTNIIKIENLTNYNLEIKDAYVANLENLKITDCQIADNKYIIIPNNLQFGRSYNVYFTLTFKDGDTIVNKFTDKVSISFIKFEEKEVIDKNFKYENILDIIYKINQDEDKSNLNFNTSLVTEEFITHLIPFRNLDNKSVLTVFSSKLNKMSIYKTLKDNIIQDNSFFNLLSDRLALNIYKNDDGDVTLDLLEYNSVKDNFAFLKSLDVDLNITSLISNRVVVIGDKCYIAGKDKNDDNIVKIYNLDLKTKTLTLEKDLKVENGYKDIALTNFKNRGLVIIPILSDNSKIIIYDLTTKESFKFWDLYKGFYDKELLVTSLRNGNSLIFKYNAEADALDYCIIDVWEQMVLKFNIDDNGNTDGLKGLIRLKDGSVLLYRTNNDNGNKYNEIWRYY